MRLRPTLVIFLSLSQILTAADDLPEIVITATRSDTDPQKVPAQVRTLSAQELAERQARTLPEALRELPGVHVQKTSNGQGSPFIRGFTGFRNLALIDGVRFNNSIFREGPNQYWNTIDANAIQRIELVPGQGSVLYGSDAIGGTLNMFTKGTNYLNEEPGFFFHGLTSYRGSTGDSSSVMRQEFQFGEAGQWGLHLGASLKEFGNTRDPLLGEQPYTGYDEWSYDIRLDVSLDPNWTLTAVHQQLQQNEVWRTHSTIYGISYEDTEIGEDLKRAYDQARTLSYIRLAGNDLDGLIQSASFTVSLQSLTEDEHRIRAAADDRQDYLQTRVWTLGLDLQFQSQSPLGRLTYGIDYYHDWVNSGSQRYLLDGSFKSAGVQGPVGDDSGYHLLGIYLNDEIDLHERVHLTLGGRYTYARADVGRFDDKSTAREEDGFRDDWQNFSASGRVVIDLDEKDHYHLFAGVAQGFRSPNLSDLSRLDIARSGELELPSPGLEPEEFINFEIGLKANTERFTGSFGYFYTMIDNMIIRRATGEVIDGDLVVEKKNAGDGYMQGLELAGEYRFTPNWSAFGQVTWTEGRVDQFVENTNRLQIEPLSRVIPFMWRAGIRWQSTDRRLWSEFVALGQSHYNRLNSSDLRDTQRIPPEGNPSFAILTLRGGWEITKNFGVNVALENLGNEQYRYTGSGSNEAGFNAILGATVRW